MQLGNPISGTYPEKLKAGSQRAMCTPMFIGALFTTAKRWKLPKCPSMGEWETKRGTLKSHIIPP